MNKDEYGRNPGRYDSIKPMAGHTLTVLVIDCSSSMLPYFKEMEDAFSRSINSIKKDGFQDNVDLCVIGYGKTAEILISPTPIADVDSIVFTDMGLTDTAFALEVAFNEVSEWRHRFNGKDIEIYTPWIILVTGGVIGHGDKDLLDCDIVQRMNAILDQIHRREEFEKLRLYAIGVGADCDVSELSKITSRHYIMDDCRFDVLFEKALTAPHYCIPGYAIYPEGISLPIDVDNTMAKKFFEDE